MLKVGGDERLEPEARRVARVRVQPLEGDRPTELPVPGFELAGRTVTALPKRMEWSAWAMTFATRGNYFRTYPIWVRDEVKQALGPAGRFDGGPLVPSYGAPFTVRDGNLLTARWPGDAQRFAEELLEMLESTDGNAGVP